MKYALAFTIGWALTASWSSISKDLVTRTLIQDCKAATGAYECVLTAMPQQQPAWVKNGESE